MRRSGNYEAENQFIDSAVYNSLITARYEAEEAATIYHFQPSQENLRVFREKVTLLHRVARTKWSASTNLEPPEPLMDEEGELKTWIEDLSASELQEVLDQYGRLYEKLNLHGKMKERAENVGIGGKEFVQQQREDEDG